MIKKMILAFVASVFLMLSMGVSAETIVVVWNCELNDGKTKDDAMAVGAKWIKWAREVGGTDDITSSYVVTGIGKFEGFLWVDTYPDLDTWAKVTSADQGDASETAAAYDEIETCSQSRMLISDSAEPAE